jgi:hypothetical protein
MEQGDLLDRALNDAYEDGHDDAVGSPETVRTSGRTLRKSLARIRAVVEANEAYHRVRAEDEAGRERAALFAAMNALTPDDRRLLGMDE